MNNEVNEAMEAYKRGEKTLEELNEVLRKFGYHLDPNKNPGGGWTEAEMVAGFRPGVEAAPLPDRPDMGRRTELAGQTVVQKTRHGSYAVSYDEYGYAVKAVRQ